jgi:hypothetical protein
LFRLRFSAAGPADFPANFRHGKPADAAQRSAPAPSCHPVAADNNDTDRLAIERGENEGMPVHSG